MSIKDEHTGGIQGTHALFSKIICSPGKSCAPIPLHMYTVL